MPVTRTLHVDLQVACDAEGLPSPADIRNWVRQTVVAAGGGPAADCEVVVRVVAETESQELNRRYRERDNPTNVLAFPVGSDVAWPPGDVLPLGDLVVCAPVVEREAREQGKSAAAHWAHMLVHGTLHLLGFGHEASEDAAEMERLEKSILATGGVGDPYAPR